MARMAGGSPLVGVEWLREHLRDPGLRLLDVRWSVGTGPDLPAYLEGHLPGASFVDLDRDLAGPPGPRGRHPLPTAQGFSEAMRSAGVNRRDRVIAYDEVTGAAARAWWLLRAAGHPRVEVLDGGLEAWRAGGGELEGGRTESGAGDFTARGFAGWVDADGTAALLAAGSVVVDARSPERFRGEPSPLDPRPGHIPGARSLPWTVAYEGGVVDPARLRAELARASPDAPPGAAYCGSGVTACALILALESQGVSGVKLYPGSWSEWAQDPQRPAELAGD